MLDEVLWHPDAVHGGLSWEEQVGAAEKRGVFVAGGSVRIRQTLGGNHILAVASKIVVGGKRTYPSWTKFTSMGISVLYLTLKHGSHVLS